MNNVLENAIVSMIRNHRFYSKIILRLKRVYSTDIPTMCVDIKDGATLIINPHFFKNHSINEQVAFLIHEINHLAFHHGERIQEIDPDYFKPKTYDEILKSMSNPSNWNKAADIAINQLIKNLPDKVTMYDSEGNSIKEEDGSIKEYSLCTIDALRSYIPNVKSNMPVEYYYNLLQKHGDKEGDQKSYTLLDNHEELNDKDNSSNKDLEKEIIKKIFNEAARESDAGEIPAEMREMINSLNNTAKDWSDDLSVFVSRCAKTELESTKRRRSRRYGWTYPGTRYEPKLVLAVVLDESGSVTDPQLEQFMVEIDAIYQLGVEIVVIHCDTRVSKVELYEGQKINRESYGGTSFRPAFDLVQSDEFISEYGEVDGLIYLTDGDNYDNPDITEPDHEVLWALLENCNTRYSWGYKTEIVLRKK